ncbi:ketosteroid isomerase family protein [[Mycobacterium] burgundiense]|jgi:steroid delta-isomerase|uniref:Ketosteroid isomerase family protein n=1 Tax=[Mycobacterium] burgundiense TaxID=3064286 RepID=A0ABM9LUP4_9MYCO|nr:ketosteroid isomerase family protein [Mycolicibacterium sp. MU0053]CAJ1505061.1 ketosteroid isomerase family protein [Mycolicibacterium sp. MU0053]
MTDTSTDISPALAASQASWRAVHTGDREAWLALMADDVLIEDPIGQAPTNADGTGVRGKENVYTFYDNTIGKATTRRITCEETFPSSSPQEIAHILNLHFEFEGGFTSDVRGIFTYRVNDAGLLTNLRGYWNMDAMKFGQVEPD